MIIDGDIAPLLTAFTSLIFRPLHLYFTTIPSIHKDDAWHFKFEWVVFLHLHA